MEKFVKELLTDDVIKSVASIYGLYSEKLTYIGGFENYIYGFNKDENAYILRLSHSSHRNVDELEAEMDFVFYLAKNGANVSMPIYSINQKLVETVRCNDDSYFTVSAFTKAIGEAPNRHNMTNTAFYNYGKTIGKFHRLTKDYQVKDTIKPRFIWSDDLLITQANKYLPKDEQIVNKRLNEIIESIQSIKKSKDNFGLIHSDIHMGNFFVANDELSIFDFDDACYHYFISDIAIALFYLVFMMEDTDKIKTANNFLPMFMKGYFSENILSKKDFLSMPYFLKLRELILYIVIYRTLDVEKNEFAKAYISKYKDRIIHQIPFIELDYSSIYDEAIKETK